MSQDTLGWRAKIGVVVPSTNTVVEAELADMRPPGVTNNTGRIAIPNLAVSGDDDFAELIRLILAAQDAAFESVLSCQPDHVILGISAETFWDGADESAELKKRLEASAGVGVTTAAEAIDAALAARQCRRIAVVTPYHPAGDGKVATFFQQKGYTVAHVLGLCSPSPVATAQVSEATLRDALRSLDASDPEAIVQVGTNLPMARLAAEAEGWLGKPVIAANTALYWRALRVLGIDDRVYGWGPLLSDY